MASKSKKPHLALETPDNTESSSSSASPSSSGGGSDSSSEVDDNDEVEHIPTEEIQVEFEARVPEEVDFPGIVVLLKKSFGTSSNVDITSLANAIIRQRSVGSVVTQSHAEDEDDQDQESDTEDMDDEPNNEVFGVATVIPLEREDPVSDQIIQYLSGNCCDEELGSLLSNPEHVVGLLINERIINMPPQISVPLYETLVKEIKKAVAKSCTAFNFTHYVLISKVMCPPKDDRNLMYVNAEEELIAGQADAVYNLKHGEQAGAVATLSRDELLDKRAVIVFQADKLDKMVTLIKASFPIT